MTGIELKTHQVWQDLAEILESLNPDALVTEHLKLCEYKVGGYWDENGDFYEEIILPSSLYVELVSSSLGITDRERWIQFKFFLKADTNASEKKVITHPQKFGELILIYDENLEFIDEKWQIDIDFPLVVTKGEQQ